MARRERRRAMYLDGPPELAQPTAPLSLATSMAPEMVRVLVGPEQKEFTVNKTLLCTSSDYFRDGVDAVPAALSSSTPPTPGRQRSVSDSSTRPSHSDEGLAIWLSGECPHMFSLFVLWLASASAFRAHVDDIMSAIAPDRSAAFAATHTHTRSRSQTQTLPPPPAHEEQCRRLHWNLVKLHLFAAQAGVPALQDAALDALQDLYLRRDWDMSPGFLRLLYAECDATSACRLRKWAVAMLAWTLSHQQHRSGGEADAAAGGSSTGRFAALFAGHPDLKRDYDAHTAKMKATRANVRIKNPQLRIPTNALRNEERHFGFRMCSFHSHRKEVGQGRCPHATAARVAAELRWRRGGEIPEEDEEEPVLSPLSTTGSSASERSEIHTPVDSQPPMLEDPLPVKMPIFFLDLS